MNDEQRILETARNTIQNGIIGTESLIAQLELLRILSLEDIQFPALVYQILQQNASLLERLCNQYGLDRIVDLVVPQGQVIPPRATAIEETKRILQAELDNWQRFKRGYRSDQ